MCVHMCVCVCLGTHVGRGEGMCGWGAHVEEGRVCVGG